MFSKIRVIITAAALLSPICAHSDTLPHVFVADDNGVLSGKVTGLTNLSHLWPAGVFSVDVATSLFGTAATTVSSLRTNGLTKIINEGFVTYPYSTPSDASGLWLTNFTGAFSTLKPPHSEDSTQGAILTSNQAIRTEAKHENFDQFMFVDYVWPWDDRFGYGTNTVTAFRTFLNGSDSGIVVKDSFGNPVTLHFWDYVALYTDLVFAPSDLGLASWNSYTPVAQSNTSENYYIFNALYHYAHARFLQEAADQSATLGIAQGASFNGEDINNGEDVYTLLRSRGPVEMNYEFFGNPSQTNGWYHTLKYMGWLAQRYGSKIGIIGEIAGGGHGNSRYTWDIAYPYYYDITAAGNPIDYNVQYMEADWSVETKGTAQYGRYAHWAGGALGFMERHSETSTLQAQKPVVLVSYRNILESGGGFWESLNQSGNIAFILDELHYPFDQVSREEFGNYAINANVLVYSPDASSPMHYAAVSNWIASGSGRTLITFAYVPFRDADKTLSTSAAFLTSSIGLNLGTRVFAVTHTIPTVGYSATKDSYPLTNGTVVLTSNEGHPLITKVSVGANTIYYVNVDISNANNNFEQYLVQQVMALANVSTEATSPTGKFVHIHSVPGGSSAVIWDSATLTTQSAGDSYSRIGTTAANIVFNNLTPSVSYKIYDFFAKTTNTVTSTAQGTVTYSSAHSVDIVYLGLASDPTFAFANTLANVQNTRNILACFDSGTGTCTPVPTYTNQLAGVPCGP